MLHDQVESIPKIIGGTDTNDLAVFVFVLNTTLNEHDFTIIGMAILILRDFSDVSCTLQTPLTSRKVVKYLQV